MDSSIYELCPALADLDQDEREAIRRLGQEVSYAEGERVIEEGSKGTHLFILLSGRVQVQKGGRGIAQLEPGSVLGEMALFNEDLRTSEAQAVRPSTLLAIPTAQLVRLVLQQDPAAIKLFQALGRIMVQRLQEGDADLLRRASQEDPTFAASLEEFAALRRRLVSDWALRYHATGKPGKLVIAASKPVGTAADLSVAYSPGVAEPCLAIKARPEAAYDYTSRGHLVGVVTNGTAILGLGSIGALAGKPVMEGKAVLFKRFADLDAFDIEVDELDPARFVDVVCALAPTFGGINLEDIRAPECFGIEAECQRRLDIPVFHDDQHGTSIVVGAGLLNALALVGKGIGDVRVVFSGAGAAGFACARFCLRLGVRRENLVLTDKDGVVYRGRSGDAYLQELAADTPARTLGEAIQGADVFVGLSAPKVMTPRMLQAMNRDPIVFGLANPVPEIERHEAIRARPDVMLATGRSDYPNQINNVIAFPYIFRGALDTRARAINEEMKLAATQAIASLAKEAVPAWAGIDMAGAAFGRDYFIPKPFDRRLLGRVARAVAEAAIRSGAARRQLDPEDYGRKLDRVAQGD